MDAGPERRRQAQHPEKKDMRNATLITVLAFVITAAVAVVAYLIPIG